MTPISFSEKFNQLEIQIDCLDKEADAFDNEFPKLNVYSKFRHSFEGPGADKIKKFKEDYDQIEKSRAKICMDWNVNQEIDETTLEKVSTILSKIANLYGKLNRGL